MTKQKSAAARNFKKPSHWDSAPPPKPAPPKAADVHGDGDRDGLSPTRYGDWEKNGIAIDF